MKLPLAISTLVFALVLPPVASAAVRVWDGGGADANWMTAENWVGDVAPVPNEDSLEFPEGAARKSSSNNFPASSLFLGIHFSGATGGYVLSGQLLRLGGPVTSANSSGFNTITFVISTSTNAALTAVHSGGGLTLGQLNLPMDLALSGAGNINITGLVTSPGLGPSGTVTKSGTGVTTLTAANTYTGATLVLDGTLMVNGVQSSSAISMSGGTLGGIGTLGAVNASAGTVSPGASPGTLKVGNVTMGQGAAFRIELNGTGTSNSDQLNVAGNVTLNGAVLDATLGFVPSNTAEFTIISNDGTDAVMGTFAGLPQGSSLTIGSRPFTINYSGGTGNDVVLTATAIAYIAGTVTNATTGAPVPSTSIWIYSSTGSFVTSTSTNAQGAYQSGALATGTYLLRAVPPSSSGVLARVYDNLPCANSSCSVTNGTPVTVTAPSPTPNINFVLPTGATISGTVTSAMTGAPVPDTSITIYSSTGSSVTSVVTNAQGAYITNTVLPMGSYFVKAVPVSSSRFFGQLYNNLPCTDSSCNVTDGTPVAVSTPNGTTVNFALSTGAGISGTVTDATTGAPVADVNIEIFSQDGYFYASARTDAQGAYTTRRAMESGSYFVTALPQPLTGLLGQLYNNLSCHGGSCSVTSGTPVPVTAPNTATVNFSLPTGGAITGTVRESWSLAPVANTLVTIYSSTGSPLTSTSTNAQGVYRTTVGLATGSYFVRASPPASSILLGQLHSNVLCHVDCVKTSGTPVAVTSPSATIINFVLPFGQTISGRVTNATTSEGVSSAQVRFYTGQGASAGAVYTDAQGFYVSPTLVPGFYFVLANVDSSTGLVDQLYDNVPCPESNCSVLSGTPVHVVAGQETPVVNFNLIQAPLASNDTFETATVINSLPYQSIVNTTDATAGIEDPAMPCGSRTRQSVWYVFTPTVTGTLAINTYGSSYSTAVAVYTGSPGGFTSIGCSDNTNSSQSALTFQSTVGQRLAILVTSGGSGRILVLNVAAMPGIFGKLSPDKGVTTRPSSVTLSWGASPDAQSYEYCLIPTGNTFCSTSWVSAGSATDVSLTGLVPNTRYSWHVRAVNTGATVYADGSESAFWSFTTSRSPVVDLDGDRDGDVFAHNPATGGWQRQVSLGDGTFAAATGGWSAGWSVTPTHFDADALTDFFIFNTTSGEWMKTITTSFGFTVQSTGTWWPGWERHVLDLNGDGLSDFFLYDPATGTWFKSLSTATGFTYTQGGWNPGWEVYPMRFNQDAYEDMFLLNRTTGRWFWVLGAADGTFTYPASEAWYAGWLLYPGDFNGDGLTDLLLHDPPTGTYFVATTTGSGFTYVQGGWSLGWTPWVVDLNADGRDDLFLHDPLTGVWFQMISDGAGHFTNVGGQTWSQGWTLYPSDFNGDGRADFLLYDAATGAWYQARNLVNGTFIYTSGTWAPGLTVVTRASVR